MTDILKNYVLEGLNISKSYNKSLQKIKVLDDVNLSISPAKITAITGISGSGKSTLLHILGLLDIPDSGSIIIDGINASYISEKHKNVLRNKKLGFIYQFHHLLPEFSVLENVAMPLIVRRTNWNKSSEKAKKIISRLGLSKREDFFPHELSGGECQRVAIARALISDPICILADEPTGNLDKKTSRCIFNLLTQLSVESGTAFVVVTHDLDLASLANYSLIMKNGKLISN